MSKSTQVKLSALKSKKTITKVLISKDLTSSKHESSQVCHNREILPSKRKLAVSNHSSLKILERRPKSKIRKLATWKRLLWKAYKELMQEVGSKMKMIIGCMRTRYKKILRIEG